MIVATVADPYLAYVLVARANRNPEPCMIDISPYSVEALLRRWDEESKP